MVLPYEQRSTPEEIAAANKRYFDGLGTLCPRPPINPIRDKELEARDRKTD